MRGPLKNAKNVVPKDKVEVHKDCGGIVSLGNDAWQRRLALREVCSINDTTLTRVSVRP